MARLRTLLADPDPALRSTLSDPLYAAGFDPIVAEDGAAALRIGRSGIEVAIVDALLGAVDGLDVVRTLRDERFRRPIVLLSTNATELERIVAYEVGVDDFVAKPFSPRELIARLRAVVRRSNIPYEAARVRLNFGRLEVDESAREARVDGRTVALKPREFTLLLALAGQPGVAMSRMALLERVWGFDFDGDERTVDVHVRRLRLKIEERFGMRCVHTVHGYGYKFALSA